MVQQRKSPWMYLALPRLFGLRRRYLITRTGMPRLRCIAGGLLGGIFSVCLLLGTNGQGSRDFHFTSAALPVEMAQVSVPSSGVQALAALAPASGISAGGAMDFRSVGTFAFMGLPTPPVRPDVSVITLKRGDTAAQALERAGFSPTQATQAVEAMRAQGVDPRKMRAGQTIAVRGGGVSGFRQASMTLDPLRTMTLREGEGGRIRADLFEKPVRDVRRAAGGRITSSLYGAAAAQGVPAPVVAQMIRMYSYDVDFQRDIHAGDSFEVLYTARQATDGTTARGGGDILYARLNLGRRSVALYRYEDADGNVQYFGPNGGAVKKALMRTPIDGARISSSFGMRRHPILGYSKMHKGMDFAAPSGTPIYAAGDGTVEKASAFSGYGNYVRIRHTGDMKTAYGHLKGYAKGIRAGVKVKQGDVIGYVGSTGRSTGPHLHYEVIVGGAQVNPAKVKQAMSAGLSKREAKRFRANVASLNREYATALATASTHVASR